MAVSSLYAWASLLGELFLLLILTPGLLQGDGLAVIDLHGNRKKANIDGK
jgi:hypothetical protein